MDRRKYRSLPHLVGGVRLVTLPYRPRSYAMAVLVCRRGEGVEKHVASASSASVLSSSLTQLGAGAVAGLVNTLVLSPLDVVKTRLQVQGRYNGTFHALRTMLREEGIGAYYRGLSASLMAFIPNWSIWWVTYETCKTRYASKMPDSPRTVIHIAAAVTSGAVTAVTTSPLWVLKARMQTQIARGDARRYTSVPQGIAKIIREEGVSGLYKGLAPSLIGLGHVAVQFPLYEQVKHVLSSGDESAVKPKHVLIASSISKAAASSLFYPHEVLRSRLQVDRTNLPIGDYGRVLRLARKIIQTDGYAGFYRGFGANLLRTVPACMLTFSSYEFAKRFVERKTAEVRRARIERMKVKNEDIGRA